jgi:glycosyltransferase involved in cell wall biosynthesis
MRVLMVVPPLPTSADPDTMTMPPLSRQIRSLQASGVEIDVLEMRGLPKVKYLQLLPKFWARAAKADLIHAHYGFCGWLARMQVSKPLVVSFMGDDILGTPDETGRLSLASRVVVEIDRWLARWVNAVIVKSAEMAEIVQPVVAHVVPNGVDLTLFRPQDRKQAQQALGWPTDKRYLLFPGNPDNPRKGFPLAQAAVQLVNEQSGQAFELVPLRNVQPDLVPRYMNACEAMLLTSQLEGSPNVVKEAMACNLPVVSVPVGDVEYLLQGAAGYSVQPRDPAQLAKSLLQVLALTPEQINGRATLQRRGLSLEQVAERIIQIYQQVLAGQR